MSLKPITILRRARKLIENRQSWIKGAFTKQVKGVRCYCGLGALAVAAGRKITGAQTLDGNTMPEYTAAHKLLAEAASGPGSVWFPSFNDAPSTRHAKVLAAFDRAIAAAKGL